VKTGKAPFNEKREKKIMLSVQTNVSAISAQRHLAATNNHLSTTMERLSSGFRINRAADDAAGLAVSEKLKAQIGGLNQASRNAQDGISMIQTAEGALDEVQAMMQRMRDLAVQAASDTNSQTERDNINLELDQLGKEIDSISSRTKFNGQLLLDGSLVTRQATTSTATVGTAIGTGGSVSAIDVSVAKSGTTYNVAVNTDSGVVSLTDTVTTATATYTALTAAGQSATLDFATFGIKISISSGTSAGLTVDDLSTALNGDTVVTATGSAAAVLQTGANKGDETSVALVDTRLTGNSITGGAIDAMASSLGTFKGTHSRSNASDLIEKLDNALNFISSNRAVLGAAQNRLQHTIANLSTTAENLSASNSRIRDVDVATESSAMAKSQVLTQAGVAVLAQANQMPQLALKLLS
jgi:flagellin